MRFARRAYHVVVGYLTGDLFRHHKGGVYRRLLRGTDSTGGREGAGVTVYLSLKYLRVHVRDDSEMYALVTWPDGARRPRFTPLEAWREDVTKSSDRRKSMKFWFMILALCLVGCGTPGEGDIPEAVYGPITYYKLLCSRDRDFVGAIDCKLPYRQISPLNYACSLTLSSGKTEVPPGTLCKENSRVEEEFVAPTTFSWPTWGAFVTWSDGAWRLGSHR